MGPALLPHSGHTQVWRLPLGGSVRQNGRTRRAPVKSPSNGPHRFWRAPRQIRQNGRPGMAPSAARRRRAQIFFSKPARCACRGTQMNMNTAISPSHPLVYVGDASTPEPSAGRLSSPSHRTGAALDRARRLCARHHTPGRADAPVTIARGGGTSMSRAIAPPTAPCQ